MTPKNWGSFLTNSVTPLYVRAYRLRPLGVDEKSLIDEEPCGIVYFHNSAQYANCNWMKNGNKWIHFSTLHFVEISESVYGTDESFELFPVLIPTARPIRDTIDRYMDTYLLDDLMLTFVIMLATYVILFRIWEIDMSFFYMALLFVSIKLLTVLMWIRRLRWW